MARLPRLQAPGAVYHVTARGTGPCAIFLDDSDRKTFLVLLEDVVVRTTWHVYAYCLMHTHYHLLLETPEANLADGMRRLNGFYASSFNRRHARVGHLFQGRYHSGLIQTEGHLLEVIRYIALNPVKAGRCERPDEWEWGSYREIVGHRPLAPFLSPRALEIVADDSSDVRNRLRRFVEGATPGSDPVKIMGSDPVKPYAAVRDTLPSRSVVRIDAKLEEIRRLLEEENGEEEEEADT